MATANPDSLANQDMAPELRDSHSSLTQIDEKKARKRQLDRISQRRKRQKDRDTMDRLKRNLELPHNPTILHSLVLKQEQDLARIQRHRERMAQIKAIVQADLVDLGQEQPSGHESGENPQSNEHGGSPQAGFEDAPFQSQEINGTSVLLQPGLDLDGLSWDDIDIPHLQPETSDHSYLDILPVLTNGDPALALGMLQPANNHLEPPITLQSQKKSVGSPLTRSKMSMTEAEQSCIKCESRWKMANLNIGLAQYQHRTSRASHISNDSGPDTDAHLIITAITEGWAAAEQSPFWNEQWSVLRQVDQICHSDSGAAERLVILFNVRRMIKYFGVTHERMIERLPKFLHERPSQMSIPHAIVIDYFVWPGFREHVIFNHQRYCNNDFSRLFAKSIKFLWPYEVRDTYVRNRQTNLYHFSRTFLDQADDLRCYTLDSTFFAKYPEFRGDVPIYESLPRICRSLDTCSPSWQYFPANKYSNRLEGRKANEDLEEIF